eukprot:4605313-Pleurochrysis_carterae.AAC.1
MQRLQSVRTANGHGRHAATAAHRETVQESKADMASESLNQLVPVTLSLMSCDIARAAIPQLASAIPEPAHSSKST